MLRDTKDTALAFETAAQELFNEIREGLTKAKWRIQQADAVKEQKLQAFRNAENNESSINAHIAGWQSYYEAVSPEHNQALAQAQFATQQAKYEHNEACEEAERCRRVAFAKNRLGMLAIQVVRDKQSERSVDASDKILRALNAQQELMDDGPSSIA